MNNIEKPKETKHKNLPFHEYVKSVMCFGNNVKKKDKENTILKKTTL